MTKCAEMISCGWPTSCMEDQMCWEQLSQFREKDHGGSCSSAAPLELHPGFSRPPAYLHPLGEVGVIEREEKRKKCEVERGRERRRRRSEKKRDLRGREGGRESISRAGCMASPPQLPPKALVLPTGKSCFAFTAGLLTELSVQRESSLYAALIFLHCQGNPRWIYVV